MKIELSKAVVKENKLGKVCFHKRGIKTGELS